MQLVKLNNIHIHFEVNGPDNGFPVVFANSLGTDFRVWDALLPHLPSNLRILRYDKRGHGLTDAPKAPYFMGDLVKDAAALMDHVGMENALFVGLSIGGMIAQGLAAERPDLIRAMVLCDTGVKIGTEAMWQDRIDAVNEGGIKTLEDAIIERWFAKSFRTDKTAELAGWRNMLSRTTVDGYTGCCRAIADTDLYESTARLTLPTLAVAGAEDGSTPPDLVRETADLIPHSQFEVIPNAGHLPCVEQPEILGRLITKFMKDNALV